MKTKWYMISNYKSKKQVQSEDSFKDQMNDIYDDGWGYAKIVDIKARPPKIEIVKLR